MLKKVLLLFSPALLAVIILWGCGKDEPANPQHTGTLVPLAVGNQWVYKVVFTDGSMQYDTLVVQDKTTKNGKDYYGITPINFPGLFLYYWRSDDTALYQSDQLIDPQDIPIFKLPLTIDSTIVYKNVDINLYTTVWVQFNTPKTIGAYSNCYRLTQAIYPRYSNQWSVQDESYFKAGIGMVSHIAYDWKAGDTIRATQPLMQLVSYSFK